MSRITQLKRTAVSFVSLLCLLVCMFSSMVIPVTASSQTAVSQSATDSRDINGDGTLTTLDVRLMLRHIVEAERLNEQQLAMADYNSDNKVNSADVRMALIAVMQEDSATTTATSSTTTTSTTTIATTATSATTTATTTTTAPQIVNPYDLLQESYITEGRDNITIHEDGTWTVTGDFTLAPNLTFDYSQFPYLLQTFTTDTKVKITLLDRDPNGEYKDHYIGLYDEFVGGNFYPVGVYDRVDDLRAVFEWNILNNGWKNTDNLATARTVRVEFNGSSPTATIEELRLLPEGFCSDYNLLSQEDTYIASEGAVFTYSDNELVISSENDNGSIAINGVGEYDADTLHYVHLSLASEVPFALSVHDAVNDLQITSGNTFYLQFSGEEDVYAPAGNYTVSLLLNDGYTQDGGTMPDTVSLDTLYIEPKGAGVIVVNHLTLTDELACNATAPVIPQDPGKTLTPLDPELYYGRQLLAAEDERLFSAYEYLGEQVMTFNAEIDLSTFNLTRNELGKVLQYYHDDHPEVFWLNLLYSFDRWVINGVEYVHTLYLTYPYTEDEIAVLEQQLELHAQVLLEGITDTMPYADRVRLVHDRLILSADYDMTYSKEHNHDLLGVIVDKTGVCESYSRAFQYLMYRCGINTILQIGTILENNENHMWNLIHLNGDWYQIDTTWNDPVFSTPNPDYVRYNYYNITTAQMAAERLIYRETSYFDDTYYITYPYPECTATAENYFVKYAVDVNMFDLNVMAQEIARSILANDVAVFRSTNASYTLEQMYADVINNFSALCIQANTYLPSDKQLVRAGYDIDIVELHGVVSAHIRDYS